MDRREFVDACARGGTAMAQAMRRLLAAYGEPLQHEAQACLGHPDEARDIVQLTLIRAWQRCAGFRGESELYPWLKAILRHGAIDALRRRVPQQPLCDDEGEVRPEVERAMQAADVTVGPDERLYEAQRRASFHDCASRFAAAHPEAAQVVRWIAEDGLTPAQIAPLIGRSPGATREFISQCRKKARHYFQPWYALTTTQPEATSK